jgi:hypothetical protein
VAAFFCLHTGSISNKNPVNIIWTLTHQKWSSSGYALASLLFNIALEKVIRDAKINPRGNIFYKSVQIFAYVDEIDIVGWSQAAKKEVFISLEKAAKEMGLQVNQEKTKYVPVTKKD